MILKTGISFYEKGSRIEIWSKTKFGTRGADLSKIILSSSKVNREDMEQVAVTFFISKKPSFNL